VIGFFDRLARPMLRALDPETAHKVVLRALNLMALVSGAPEDSRLATQVFGLRFPNPIGTAAGFDKGATVADAVLRLGFGFAEIGTVTPRPQAGNARPRIYRLASQSAVINRLGFNNDGFDAVRARLAVRVGPGIVGVNLGANRDTVDRVADYVAGIEAFAAVASYFTVNISSPNTPGLRDLQRKAALEELLVRVVEARERSATTTGRKPLLIKIAPDLTLSDLDAIVELARRRRLDGIIVSNTTTSRPRGLGDQVRAKQPGGLSGRPLFALSTRMLAETFVRAEGALALIGVGGVDSGSAALTKLRAGANLVQLYTGLVYRGFGLLEEVKDELIGALEVGRAPSLDTLVGVDAKARITEPWPA
jgi:dihydroorotate dehydrogenase